ncbi:MAG TPA: ABC transporter substrate-binding protein [Candidatus Hydrogenedens sp.]|nr:ABC transporter substrate-binding protein [Candidatus Hydrogenedens sp.]HPP58189.1 ABC transporter substrate-binding protein [Candidatus Hydrogenedens sp.]
MKDPNTIRDIIFIPLALCIFSSCTQVGNHFVPINQEHVVFWDRQTAESAMFIKNKANEFNTGFPELPIKVERAGGYSEIFRKVSASIQARKLPDLAVSYESMTSEYIPTGAVVSIDEFINDPEIGLPANELADFFPAVIEANRYPDFGNKLYSFPLAKSVLVLYYNIDVLKQSGINSPPQTWDDFYNFLKIVKSQTGKAGYAISIDCSTIDAMIYSFGGDIVQGRKTLFNSPETLRVFSFLRQLVKENLAFVITPGTFDDQVSFAKGDIAFMIRSSSVRISLEMLEKEKSFNWGIAPLPHDRNVPLVTVLFGPNITIFNTTPEHQRRAWQFVRFMTSTENVVQWAIETGYVPIRKSAERNPLLQNFWRNKPFARIPYECLKFARPEPNLSGWQQIRDMVESAELEVLTMMDTPENVCNKLKRQADKILSLP